MATDGNLTELPSFDDEFVSYHAMRVFAFIDYVVLMAIIGISGIVFNILNIVIFIKMGFTDVINFTLLSLSVADVGVLLTMVGYSVTYNPLVEAATPSELMLAVNYVIMGPPHILFSRVAGCLTAFVALERFLCVAWPLRVKLMVTPTRTKCVVFGVYVFLTSCTIPIVIAYPIGLRFNQELNLTTVGLVQATNADLLQNFTFIIANISQVASFVIVTLSTLGLVRSLFKVTTWRASASTPSQHSQQVTTRRDKQLVKMVLLISTVFIVFSLPTVIANLLMVFLKDFNVNGRYRNLFALLSIICFTLDSFNSTVNIFIYCEMSSKFREKLRSIFRRRFVQTGLRHKELKNESINC